MLRLSKRIFKLVISFRKAFAFEGDRVNDGAVAESAAEARLWNERENAPLHDGFAACNFCADGPHFFLSISVVFTQLGCKITTFRERSMKGKRSWRETYHRSMNIPKCTFLTFEYLAFHFLLFFVDFTLRFGLHRNEIPLASQHVTQQSVIFRFKIAQVEFVAFVRQCSFA